MAKGTTGQAKTKPLEGAQANEQFHASLLSFRRRKVTLGLFVTIATLIFAYFISRDLLAHKSWIVIGTPLCLFAMAFILFPTTEEWIYKPWQAKPEQYEKHFLF